MPARRINAGRRGGSCAAGGRGAGRAARPGRVPLPKSRPGAPH